MLKDLTENKTLTEQEPKIDGTSETEIQAEVTCPHDGSNYTVGSEICINKLQYICYSNGKWGKTGKTC